MGPHSSPVGARALLETGWARGLPDAACPTGELLSSAGFSAGKVAGRLGDADAVACTHAFTGWAGVPRAPSRAVKRR